MARGFPDWNAANCTVGTVGRCVFCNPAERNPRYTRKSLKSGGKREWQRLHHVCAIGVARRSLDLSVPAHESPDQEDRQQTRYEHLP